MFNLSAILKKSDVDNDVSINTSSLRAVTQKTDTSKVRIFSSIGCQTPLANNEEKAQAKKSEDPWAGIMPMFG